MAIAPMSADQSAAAWAGDAAAAAEAYVQSQADAAAAQRDYEEKLQAELAALAANQNDGVDPPPPPAPPGLPLGQQNYHSGGSSANNSSVGGTTAAGSGSSAGSYLISDGNGGYIFIPPDTANVSVTQQAPPPWDLMLPIGNSGGNSSSVQTPSNSPPPPEPQAAPSGANEVKPDEPEKPKEAPKIVSKLGAEVDKLLNGSPTLREQWEKLKADRWKVEFTDGKSRTNHRDHKIFLNPADAKNQTRLLAVLFSHESGHAVSGGAPQVTAEGHTKPDYIKQNVEARLTAEGAAAFENCRHREEILAATGVDIGIAGKNSDKPYLQIYEDYKSGKISEETAKHRMGQLMGEEWEYPDGTTKRQAYTAEEADDYERERAGVH
jgi:hypothetical protein